MRQMFFSRNKHLGGGTTKPTAEAEIQMIIIHKKESFYLKILL